MTIGRGHRAIGTGTAMTIATTAPWTDRKPRAAALLSQRTLIRLFFFTSGIPALVYQLSWQRALFRIFGVDMVSVTIVVTAFMLGLGLGSLIGSRLALRRAIPPLLLIAAIELSVGLFGAVSLQLFDAADPLVRDLPLAGQVAAALGLLFLPTALMGMTLPLLVGHFISRSANVGLSTGDLYRVNTLGAVAGCMLAALAFFPWLGLQHTVWAAAGINGAIGAAALAAFLVTRRATASSPATLAPAPAHAPLEMPLRYRLGLVLAFLAGFVSLSYEIFLVRLATFESGTGATALTLTLAGFLLGVASGAQDAAQWCAKAASPGELAGKIARGLMWSALASLALLPLLSVSHPLGKGMIAVILLATVIVARALGTIFPVLAHVAVPADDRSGGRVGQILLADILGSAAGSLLTGFVLADWLDARAMAVTLALMSLAVAAPFAWLGRGALKRPVLLAALGAAGLLALFQAPLSSRVMDAMLYKEKLATGSPLTRVLENRDGIITVSRDGTVSGNGVYDGIFNLDLLRDVNGVIRAYGLSLFHPHPHDVLMVGLASGSWAQVVAANPDVAHLTVVEINPGYLPLIRERPQIASLLKNPKVQIVIDDGRRWLRRHPGARFDAVIANTSYHFRANATNVLSQEFDALVRAHLKQGGIFFYNATGSRRAQRTGCANYRHGYGVMNNILVSDSPFDLDVGRWRRNLLATRIDGKPVFDLPRDAALLRWTLTLPQGADGPLRSGGQRMQSCAAILAATAQYATITDDNMGTEWRWPLGFE